MRFTVTALGAAGGRPVAAVAADIVEYLHRGTDAPAARNWAASPARNGEPAVPDPGERAQNGTGDDPARYYADAGEGPGRWIGTGAGTLGLRSEVVPKAFRSVLAGRHPGTGERLISARGSAGRVADLGAGSAAAYAPDGEALYGLADVATVLGWSLADAGDAAAEGERAAAARLFGFVAGTGTGPVFDDDPAGIGMVLVPVLDRDGSVLVREAELSRVEALVNESRSGRLLAGTGDPGEIESAAEAARLIGASRSYVARLCRTWEEHRNEIVAAAGTANPSRRSYVEATRDPGGGWRIRRQDLAAFMERRRQPAVRVGYDVTATTEKSISVLALLGGSDVRAEVLAAVREANDTGMRWLERNAACARAGKEIVAVEGWTVASFQHLTSRRLDPFVHHHNVVANTVVDQHGIRRALDARPLYRRVSAGSAIATAQVRWELVTRLGVAFRPATRHGGWEIDGIDDRVIEEFSSRTREVRETIKELEDILGRTSTMAEFRAVVAGSRPAKRSADEAAVVAQWWSRARARGLDPGGLARCVGRRPVPVMTARRRNRILDALGRAVTEERSVFTRMDVLATLVDLPDPEGSGPVLLTAAALEHLTDEFLASDRAVRLRTTSGRRDRLVRKDGTSLGVGGGHEPEYCTTEMLASQARTLRNYRAGIGTGTGTVPAARVAEALARVPNLAPEQRHMAAAFCTSGDLVQSGVGRAGTGKTYAMRAAVHAWEAAGYRVLGAAVKAEAARHLGRDCGIPAEPLAWYLNRLDDPGRNPLDARTVLIVDEASTIGDRDLDTLVAAARRDGTTLRLIGDPAQHSSVNAGGLWGVVTRRLAERTPELVEGRRLRHPRDRAAAEALREGYAGMALAELEAAGHLHIVADDRELYAALIARWWDARQAGTPHPMVDRRNDQRLILNRLARTMRHHRGELGDIEIGASGERRYAAGDEVTARMGDRDLHPEGKPEGYVRNGAHGVVTNVRPGPEPGQDQIVVDFGHGSVPIPRAFFDEHTDRWGRTDVGIDHAYAVVSYAVEGLTFDESSSHVDPRSTRPEVYVDITRGRNANHVFVSTADDDLSGERLPAVPAPGLVAQLRERLAGVPGEPVAIDLDPDAAEAALARWSAGGRAAPLDADAAIALRAVTRPDPGLVTRLGGEPDRADLVERYRQLLADMALYRDRWRARPGRQGPWVWALGTPGDAGGDEDRAALIERLATYSIGAARHRLGVNSLNPDLDSAIVRLAAGGWLGRIDFDYARAHVAAGQPAGDALARATQSPGPFLAAEQEPIGAS